MFQSHSVTYPSGVTVAEEPVGCVDGGSTRHQERVAGHRAARTAARIMGLPIHVGRVLYDMHGAPYLEHARSVHLSISHSAQFAVAALARNPVGIDIERVRPRNSCMLLYISDETEQTLLPIMPYDTLLTSVWTIKEAVMKGARKGLAWAPRTVQILSISRADGLLCSRVLDPNRCTWRVSTVIEPNWNYVTSVAQL